MNDRTCVHSYAYGYGMFWVRDSLGRVFVGHSGGLPGFGSNWFFMPEYGLGIVFFANVTYAPMTKLIWPYFKVVVASQLTPRKLPPSKIKLLPEWENADACDIFANNFFLDCSIDSLKKETSEVFVKAGNVISVGELIPASQLKGHFILKCETMDVRINFSLTPELPPLIQQFQIYPEKP